jgi:hypothetical protein
MISPTQFNQCSRYVLHRTEIRKVVAYSPWQRALYDLGHSNMTSFPMYGRGTVISYERSYFAIAYATSGGNDVKPKKQI